RLGRSPRTRSVGSWNRLVRRVRRLTCRTSEIGRTDAVKAGGRLKYRLSELDRWLREHEESFAVDDDPEAGSSIPVGAHQVRTRKRASRVRGALQAGQS